MKLNDAFPSKYMKAGVDVDEDGQRVLTISDVRWDRVGQGADAADKLIMSFEEVEKELVLNKTNATTIGKLYGDDTDDWAGKRITLYCTYVQFQSDMVLSIRVRPKAPPAARPNGKPAPAPVAAAPQTAGDIDPDDPNAPPF